MGTWSSAHTGAFSIPPYSASVEKTIDVVSDSSGYIYWAGNGREIIRWDPDTDTETTWVDPANVGKDAFYRLCEFGDNIYAVSWVETAGDYDKWVSRVDGQDSITDVQQINSSLTGGSVDILVTDGSTMIVTATNTSGFRAVYYTSNGTSWNTGSFDTSSVTPISPLSAQSRYPSDSSYFQQGAVVSLYHDDAGADSLHDVWLWSGTNNRWELLKKDTGNQICCGVLDNRLYMTDPFLDDVTTDWDSFTDITGSEDYFPAPHWRMPIMFGVFNDVSDCYVRFLSQTDDAWDSTVETLIAGTYIDTQKSKFIWMPANGGVYCLAYLNSQSDWRMYKWSETIVGTAVANFYQGTDTLVSKVALAITEPGPHGMVVNEQGEVVVVSGEAGAVMSERLTSDDDYATTEDYTTGLDITEGLNVVRYI